MGHHFYTIDKDEGDRAEREAKFKFEGIAAFVLPSPQPGAVALHRSFNGGVGDGGDHFYTTSQAEQDEAEKHDWRKEFDACFVFDPNAPQPANTVPLLRFFNSSITDHFYTIDSGEGARAQDNGWAPEGIACFVLNHREPGTVELRRYFRRGTTPVEDLGVVLELAEDTVKTILL